MAPQIHPLGRVDAPVLPWTGSAGPTRRVCRRDHGAGVRDPRSVATRCGPRRAVRARAPWPSSERSPGCCSSVARGRSRPASGWRCGSPSTARRPPTAGPRRVDRHRAVRVGRRRGSPATSTEEDYHSRRRQLATRTPRPGRRTRPRRRGRPRRRPADPEAEEAVRDWLDTGDLARDGAVALDDGWCGHDTPALLDGPQCARSEMFSAGDRVAFHVVQSGRYRGGLPDTDGAEGRPSSSAHRAGPRGRRRRDHRARRAGPGRPAPARCADEYRHDQGGRDRRWDHGRSGIAYAFAASGLAHHGRRVRPATPGRAASPTWRAARAPGWSRGRLATSTPRTHCPDCSSVVGPVEELRVGLDLVDRDRAGARGAQARACSRPPSGVRRALLGDQHQRVLDRRPGRGPGRPEAFCGMHFFNPVWSIPLVEIVRGAAPREAAIVTAARAVATAIGKESIVVRERARVRHQPAGQHRRVRGDADARGGRRRRRGHRPGRRARLRAPDRSAAALRRGRPRRPPGHRPPPLRASTASATPRPRSSRQQVAAGRARPQVRPRVLRLDAETPEMGA